MALVGCFTPRTPVPLPNLKFYRPKIMTINSMNMSMLIIKPNSKPYYQQKIMTTIICGKPKRPPSSDGSGGKINRTIGRNIGEEKKDVKSNPAKKKEDKGSKEAEIKK
ncbi:hypothetical protein O6P43_029210 [Quillaja saponaria]|uniref:Uncharacterized protein n=1 Tax=Quillaja saponaria TaxID=32244 RepID=A0AAD7PAX8_QUISA|nr:hypothetical protein O6P43_029210 [Quillaja saponaria]